MKTKKLSEKELTETNGGNNTSSSQSGIAGALGIDNLLSSSSSSHNGDQSNSSDLSVGNGIGGDLGGILDKGSRNS